MATAAATSALLIDRFYNQKCIRSSLGYHSPVEYQRLVNA
jgi:transposase InsO family protein